MFLILHGAEDEGISRADGVLGPLVLKPIE
jgi:hypothetical protein